MHKQFKNLFKMLFMLDRVATRFFKIFSRFLKVHIFVSNFENFKVKFNVRNSAK